MISSTPAGTELLCVEDLRVQFATPRGTLRVLDGLQLTVDRGRITGLVGESGSGKSVTASSILRILRPPGRVVGGRVLFDGRDLLALSPEEMAQVRGREITMIFQNPRASLNPVFQVGALLRDILRVHQGLDGFAQEEGAKHILTQVGLPDVRRILRSYPHQLSGGMAQRVMIAMALSCRPKFLLADEPTTALDVTIQAQILDLLRKLREELGLTQLLITHDLGVIGEVCDDVAVMYAGEIVERAPTAELFHRPRHPYTKGLMSSRPRVRGGTVQGISGTVPDFLSLPTGCRFHPRCPFARERCRVESPATEQVAPGHTVRCHFWREIA